jgi:hypothetical protein
MNSPRLYTRLAGAAYSKTFAVLESGGVPACVWSAERRFSSSADAMGVVS